MMPCICMPTACRRSRTQSKSAEVFNACRVACGLQQGQVCDCDAQYECAEHAMNIQGITCHICNPGGKLILYAP